jgi:hypothetical protein
MRETREMKERQTLILNTFTARQEYVQYIIRNAHNFMKDLEEYFTPKSVFYKILKTRNERVLLSYIHPFYMIYLLATSSSRNSAFLEELKDDGKKLDTFEHSLLYFESKVIEMWNKYKTITSCYDGWKMVKLSHISVTHDKLTYNRYIL